MPVARSGLLLLFAGAAVMEARGESFVAPYHGKLYIQCARASSAATSQFGLGTSPKDFVPYLTLPSSCPSAEVLVGTVEAGQVVHFAISTSLGGQNYWAFSGSTDPGSVVAFTDTCNSLGLCNNTVRQSTDNTWLMYLNDAAQYRTGPCATKNILIVLRLAPPDATSGIGIDINFEPPLPAGLAPMSYAEDAPVIPQSTITNQYSNLGVVMTNAALVTLSPGPGVSGSNVVAPISYNNTVDYGSAVTFTFVSPLDGSTPAATDHFAFTVSIVGYSGTTNITTLRGYDINGKLLGTVSQPDTAGQTIWMNGIGDIHKVVVLSTLTDHSSGGTALNEVRFGVPYTLPPVGPMFATQSIVNAASFSASGITPGALFSIFGSGLAQGRAQAGSLPLPTDLGGTRVWVNGQLIPLFYVDPSQINAQMPLEVSPGPAQLFVGAGSSRSQNIPFTVALAGPGVFTYGQNQAVVVNSNGKVNSLSAPAHIGEKVTAYLTGGGPVHASGTWITGAASPAGPSPATLPVTITVNGQTASISYLGLTPGFVGLYQANFTMPTLPAGNYLMVVHACGQDSNGSYVSVVD
jgi:uncharacterized protein (TIGR03437 family)